MPDLGSPVWESVPMEIVELTAAHCAEAVGLWVEVGLTRPWNDPVADFTRAVEGAASTVLGLCGPDDSLVGTAMVGHDGHRCWVYYLAVAPGQQAEGHGRTLMSACADWAVAHGVPKIQLMVRSDNEPVLAFYRAIGYEQQDVVVLGRRLNNHEG